MVVVLGVVVMIIDGFVFSDSVDVVYKWVGDVLV